MLMRVGCSNSAMAAVIVLWLHMPRFICIAESELAEFGIKLFWHPIVPNVRVPIILLGAKHSEAVVAEGSFYPFSRLVEGDLVKMAALTWVLAYEVNCPDDSLHLLWIGNRYHPVGFAALGEGDSYGAVKCGHGTPPRPNSGQSCQNNDGGHGCYDELSDLHCLLPVRSRHNVPAQAAPGQWPLNANQSAEPGVAWSRYAGDLCG